MTSCLHARLIRQVGPLHAKDNPPIYRCEECNEFVRVTISSAEITVSFGVPAVDPKSEETKGSK